MMGRQFSLQYKFFPHLNPAVGARLESDRKSSWVDIFCPINRILRPTFARWSFRIFKNHIIIRTLLDPLPS